MAPWVRHASPEVNAQPHYAAIVAFAMSLTTLTIIIVVARAYIRLAIVRKLGSDDYVTFFSAIINIIYNSLAVWQTRMGLGLPLLLRPEEDAQQYFVVNFASRPLYMLGVTGYKVALCLAYLRILSGSQHVFRKVTWGALVFIIASHLATTLVIIFQCRPVSKSWHPAIAGECLANYPTWNATAAITILCDVLAFTLPIPIFWKLQISVRQKLVLIILFVLGFFTTVCSVMRMLQIQQIAKDGNNSTLVLWGTVELNVGISLSCARALKPVFERWLRSTRSAISGYATGTVDTKRNTAVQLRSLSHASVGNGSEDMLPLHHPDANPQHITKTVKWNVQRQDLHDGNPLRWPMT